MVLSLAVGLGVVSPAAATEADRTTAAGPVTDSAQIAPAPLATTIRTAQAGLTTALTYLKNHQYPEANTALGTLGAELANAHEAGMTPMRPARVIAVLDLEHQVAMSLLPPFNGLTRSDVVNALQTTLTTTFANRTAMLNAVVALPVDGAGGTYDDGMADTLPIYRAEVRAYTAAPSQFQLTAPASTVLTEDLAQVRATRAQVTKRFGGGE